MNETRASQCPECHRENSRKISGASGLFYIGAGLMECREFRLRLLVRHFGANLLETGPAMRKTATGMLTVSRISGKLEMDGILGEVFKNARRGSTGLFCNRDKEAM